MKNKVYGILLVAFCSLCLIRCNKTDILATGQLADYTNLAVGKFVIYKLDSTVTLPFGVGFTVNSYLVKDSINAMVTDNLNRPGYRIIRYVWNDATQQWTNSNTFMAVLTGK